jgi:signal transduction histidine kinase
MLSLINDILDLNSLESREDLEIHPVPIVSAARSSLETMRPMAAPKEIAVAFVANIPENLYVSGNEVALARIFNNLLSNAVKFTPRGEWIRLVLDPEENRQVRISVIDSGIGIPENKIPDVFRKYSRSSRSGTEGEHGTGLGLPITRQLVEKLRGDISISSAPGKGACVQILLPIAPNPGENRTPQHG